MILSSLCLIGTDDKGKTQTVEEILNTFHKSAKFSNIIVAEIKEDKINE